jgi:hypothetical protein
MQGAGTPPVPKSTTFGSFGADFLGGEYGPGPRVYYNMGESSVQKTCVSRDPSTFRTQLSLAAPAVG